MPHNNPATPLGLNEQRLPEYKELRKHQIYSANAAQIEGPSPKNGEAPSLVKLEPDPGQIENGSGDLAVQFSYVRDKFGLLGYERCFAELQSMGIDLACHDNVVAFARFDKIPEEKITERIAGWREKGWVPAANGNANGVEDSQSSADGNRALSEASCDEAPPPASDGNSAAAAQPDRTTGGNGGRRYEDPVIALRLGLRANGYHPVPITAPVPGDKDSGKKPLLKNWQNVCATADDAIIRDWPGKWPNTGLLCGVSTQAGALVGVDVDVLDKGLSQQIEQIAIRHLGPSPLRRVGRAPKFLLAYRVEEPMTKISTAELILPSGGKAKVEILAKGQQFVAYGIHPDTHRNYEWGDARPDSTPLADLPMVTRQALSNFVNEAEQILLRSGGSGKKETTAKAAKSARSDEKPPEWSEAGAERIRDAIKHIPADDREIWLNVGMALHSTGWGEPAFTIWEEWSKTSSKYDETDQRRTWQSFHDERPNKITLGTLF